MNKSLDNKITTTSRTLTEVMGVDPLLPGESTEGYKHGLMELIDELDAKSVLQVYLAEKIYECLWWIRRYEDQKRATIIAEMSIQVNGASPLSITEDLIHLRKSLFLNELDEKAIQTVASKGHSIESLRQMAMSRRRSEIFQLDNQIALQTKILSGMQASYEVAFNRKQHAERFELQNALMRQDLQAIKLKVVDDKSKAKNR